MGDVLKEAPPIVKASMITSVSSFIIPFFIQNVAFFFQAPGILPFAGGLGISSGIIAAILGVSAIVVIHKNKSSLSSYVLAIISGILGACSSYSWLKYLSWLVNFHGK
jgi:hypothetical protein